MRILQLAPLWERVPPPAYGGTEAVVALLTDELVRRGHDVTLAASGDSRTGARLASVYPRSLRTATDVHDRSPHDWLHVAAALEMAKDFDIVHNHAGDLAVAFTGLLSTPVLTTMHCLVTPDTRPLWNRYPWYYNAISHAERRSVAPIRGGIDAGVVYNGVDVDSFPFSSDKDDYLLYLSRISPEKGPHTAIQVARKLGKRLVIAGKVDAYDRQFFETVVRPEIDGEQVTFVGEADGKLKRELYRRALCLLMPLDWEEPFGLVMVEAMACGTPVIVFPRGAAPEIVKDGETGFLVRDADEMARAVGRVDRIDPAACRRHAEERFGPEPMTAGYLEVYGRILAETRRGIYALAAPAAHGRSGNGSAAGSDGANGRLADGDEAGVRAGRDVA